jgi:hypothetical protein
MEVATVAIGPQRSNGWCPSRTTLALLVFLGIAGFFLLTEHTAHLFGALPFLLLLACPLMHLLMHGGHGSHAQPQGEQHQHGER